MLFSRDCRQVRNLLWEMATGNVSGKECEHAQAHLARCEACRSEFDSYRITISLMSEYKREAVPASRMGWRDVERRVTSPVSAGRSWAKRPAMQLLMGGGSLALATALVMFVMQANMNPAPIHKVSVIGPPGVTNSKINMNTVAEPAAGDFYAAAGMLALTEMPTVDDSATTGMRTAPLRTGHGLMQHTGLADSNARSASNPPPVAAADNVNAVNVDGGSPVQPLRPDYVLASASSGNDDDQSRRYVIDVVSSSGASSGSDSSEESHPW